MSETMREIGNSLDTRGVQEIGEAVRQTLAMGVNPYVEPAQWVCHRQMLLAQITAEETFVHIPAKAAEMYRIHGSSCTIMACESGLHMRAVAYLLNFCRVAGIHVSFGYEKTKSVNEHAVVLFTDGYVPDGSWIEIERT